jgi:hypothetical protein
MQGDDVQSDDVWRWRSVAVSSEEPRTESSLDPRGSLRSAYGVASRKEKLWSEDGSQA